MPKTRQVDTRESVRTVTSNNFITALGLEKISLKARKLLYLAISQCKQTDKQFYEYRISALEFANLMEISASHVYEEADRITDELMHGFLKTKTEVGFRKHTLFSKCEYINNDLIFKLNPDMTDFLLNLKADFSKPLLDDFMRMNSRYSIAIWHLMQREMKSKKPGVTGVMEFDLFLDELREVTGTTDKLKQLVHFKNKVFDKAIREIKDNCAIDITYTNLKKGRTVIGFHCTAVSIVHLAKIPLHLEEKVRAFDLKQESKIRELTPAEQEEYERLTANAEQIELF